jgi:hypothetical protein
MNNDNEIIDAHGRKWVFNSSKGTLTSADGWLIGETFPYSGIWQVKDCRGVAYRPHPYIFPSVEMAQIHVENETSFHPPTSPFRTPTASSARQQQVMQRAGIEDGKVTLRPAE